MSDQSSEAIIGAASRVGQNARENVGRLLDAQGDVVDEVTRQAQGTMAQVRTYIREQPLSAGMLAVGIGYLIGRLRLI